MKQHRQQVSTLSDAKSVRRVRQEITTQTTKIVIQLQPSEFKELAKSVRRVRQKSVRRVRDAKNSKKCKTCMVCNEGLLTPTDGCIGWGPIDVVCSYTQENGK